MPEYKITKDYNSTSGKLTLFIKPVNNRIEAAGIEQIVKETLNKKQKPSNTVIDKNIIFYEHLRQIEVNGRKLEVGSAPVFETLEYLYEHRDQGYCSKEELIKTLYPVKQPKYPKLALNTNVGKLKRFLRENSIDFLTIHSIGRYRDMKGYKLMVE